MHDDCRLGLIVDFLSHATIVGFMAGAATVVCLQQLKSILGLVHFTHGADIISVMRSVFTQTHEVNNFDAETHSKTTLPNACQKFIYVSFTQLFFDPTQIKCMFVSFFY